MDLFDIAAKITLNTRDYEEGLKEAEGKGSSFADKLRGGLGKAASAIGAATKVASAGVAAGMAAAITLAKQATDAYANYEQLVGGAELLFGDAYDYIANKSKTAYKDVQMSQNEYLQQVNGFAVGLKTALGGNERAAAELAAKIVTAEADVVAATGNTQEAVQNAFNGIMKGNYTMLDNLQLGITPTKEGMQEVINKVNEWNEANGRATAYEIDNLADVQSALVDYIEMQGLAGYAANEASETIAGSAASAKAAWKDLLVAFASDGDISAAMDNVIKSVTALAKNIIPVFSKALKGIGKAVRDIAPIIAKELPGIIKEIVPIAIEIGTSLVNSLIDAFEQLFPMLADLVVTNAPTLIDTGMKMLMTIAQGILDYLPELAETAISIITQIATSIGKALPNLIPSIVDVVLQIVDTIIDNVDMLIDAAIAIITGLADGLIKAVPKLIEKAPEIVVKLVQAIIKNAPKMFEAAIEIISKLGEGIVSVFKNILQWGADIVGKIWEGIKSVFSSVIDWGGKIIAKVGEGISKAWEKVKEWGRDLIKNFWEGIKSALGWLEGNMDTVANAIKDRIGFSEPKKGPLSNFHTYAPDMMRLFAQGVIENKKMLSDTVSDAFDFSDLISAPESTYGIPALSGGFGAGEIKLYIDGDKLVGATSERMDKDLGDMQSIRARFGGKK